MIIGIDFDNTIINYEQLFFLAAEKEGWSNRHIITKSAIKQQLIEEDGDDRRWQFLQKEVYSHLIEKAKPYDGALAFLRKVLALKDSVYIISHKTEFSNLDGKTNLINPALNWLEEKGVIGNKGFLKKEQVIFCETREEKIKTIKSLKCDLFIDDLLPVLNDPLFPQNTLKILFGSGINDFDIIQTNYWSDLNVLREMKKNHSNSFIHDLVKMLGQIPSHCWYCYDGGNHRSFVIELNDNQKLFVKSSNHASIANLENEYYALKVLESNGITCIPKAMGFSGQNAFLLQNCVEGKKINKITNIHLLSIGNFIQQLDKVSIDFPFASQYRAKLNDYTTAIETRLEKINSGLKRLQSTYPDLIKIEKLIQKKVTPIKEFIFKKYNQQIKQNHLELEQKFPKNELILNPSDFGFHNIILSNDDRLFFIDFEYFGWDDKIKMVCDFIHHLGHNLNLEQKLYFLRLLKQRGFLSKTLIQRMELVIDLIGLEWVLIVLNVAQEDKLEQKKLAFSELTTEQIINMQFEKACKLLDFYQKNIDCGKDIITLGINKKDILGAIDD